MLRLSSIRKRYRGKVALDGVSQGDSNDARASRIEVVAHHVQGGIEGMALEELLDAEDASIAAEMAE